MHLLRYRVKLPYLKLKTWPKQLLGSLSLDIALPAILGQSFLDKLMDRHKEEEIEGQTDTQMDGHTEEETERWRDRQMDREKRTQLDRCIDR